MTLNLNGFSKTYLTHQTYLFIIQKFLLVTFKYTSTCKRSMSQKGQNPKVVLYPKRHGNRKLSGDWEKFLFFSWNIFEISVTDRSQSNSYFKFKYIKYTKNGAVHIFDIIKEQQNPFWASKASKIAAVINIDIQFDF